jgi:HAD superfamily hydrolase (TIGR01509 family)
MQSLVLDLGNVLAFFDHRRACRQIAALARPGTTEDDVFDLLFHQPLERQYDTGEITTSAFIAALRSAFGITAGDDAIAEAWSDIFEPNDDLMAQLPALKAVVKTLVLASNTNELHFTRIRRIMPGTIALFNATVVSFEVGVRKPSALFFERVIAATGGPAGACIYVDDRPDLVAAAEALGMRGCVYERGDTISVTSSARPN